VLIYQTGEVLKEYEMEEEESKRDKRDRPFIVSPPFSLLLVLALSCDAGRVKNRVTWDSMICQKTDG
jgi:hypothetical protein